jgi:hypothetical protein
MLIDALLFLGLLLLGRLAPRGCSQPFVVSAEIALVEMLVSCHPINLMAGSWLDGEQTI